jgi:NAD(P)-dependent dehydrogenase (short-subunit alcohol dehydrogenase family)
MTAQYPEGYLDRMMGRVPAGRPGDPDAASYVTGAVLPVDGGLLVT